MIEHVVLFRWREGIDEKQRRSAIEHVNSLVSLTSIVRFSSGENIARSSYHYVAIMTFRDQSGVDAFWRDPAHREVMAHLKPLIADVAICDFVVPEANQHQPQHGMT